MRRVYNNITECVGETPNVRLNSVSKGVAADVYAKIEYMNPGCSVKDRIALQIIEDAEKSGELKPGGTIVEGTSGNTGAGLAMAAATKGYKCVFVLPDKQSEEKRAALRAYGARVVVTPTNVDADDPRSYYKVSRRIADETPNSYYANQYHNPSNPKAHYLSTGPEIWSQFDGKLDYFIAGIGTGGTITGTGKYLKEKNPNIKIIGVDPVGSIYYDYFKTGQMTEAFSYVLEGIGEDFLPSTMDFEHVDDVVRVNDVECFQMTRELCQTEGIFGGGSSGAAVAGGLKYLKLHSKAGETALILIPDNGSRYISKIYNDKWMEENGFLDKAPSFGSIRDLMVERESYTVKADTSILEAVGLMKVHGISQMPVFNGDTVVGVVHERTILEHALSGGHHNKTVADVADNNYCVVDTDTEIAVLMELFRKVRLAVVMQGGKFVGVLTRIDIIDHIAKVTK
jgi:cystathionine beta-synthase